MSIPRCASANGAPGAKRPPHFTRRWFIRKMQACMLHALQKWKSLRVLGFTEEKPPGPGMRQATSVYGAFSESGCLGAKRFCKFSHVGRPTARRLQHNRRTRPVAPRVLSVDQWWRLLGVFRPSGASLCVSEGFASGDWRAHDNPGRTHGRPYRLKFKMLRQGHVMITSDSFAFIPACADV